MKILAICQALDLSIRHLGITPAWWQIMKGLSEAGAEIIAVPYIGRGVESLWWRSYENPALVEYYVYHEIESMLTSIWGKTRMETRQSMQDFVRPIIRDMTSSKWPRYVERILTEEKDVDAILILTVPINHLTGVPAKIKGHYDLPIVYYDGDTRASFLYGSFDRLALIPLVSLTALGVYGAAVTAFSAYGNVIGGLSSVLLPVFSGVYRVKGPEVLEDSIRTASRYVSIVAMPLAFALLATARPALTLLVGNSYQGGVIPLAVLALGSIATIVALSFGPVLIVLNETTLAALTSILPIPFGVAVVFILIPVLGIVGASIARAFTMLLGLVLAWHFVRRKITVKLDFQAILKSIVASGGMALVMEALQLFYYSRFLLPAYLAVGFLAYLLAMRELKATSAADIDLLRRMLGPRFNRMCNLLSRLLLQPTNYSPNVPLSGINPVLLMSERFEVEREEFEGFLAVNRMHLDRCQELIGKVDGLEEEKRRLSSELEDSRAKLDLAEAIVRDHMRQTGDALRRARETVARLNREADKRISD